MSQHDMDVANQGYAAFRADMNDALKALASTSIGAAQPGTRYQGQRWIDSAGTPWLEKVWDGAAWIVTGQIDPTADVMRPNFPRDHIAGLITSTNGLDADHDVDIASGECRDAANTFDIVVGGTITVAVDAAGENGLDTGTVAADGTYALWLIADSSRVNQPAGLFSLDFASPVMPAGYDKRRLIGFRVTDASANIVDTVQVGDYFRLLAPPECFSDTAPSSAVFKTGTILCPPDCEAVLHVDASDPTSANPREFVFFRRKGASDDQFVMGADFDGATFDQIATRTAELVDQNSQVEYKLISAAGAPTLTVDLIACRMLTRSAPLP